MVYTHTPHTPHTHTHTHTTHTHTHTHTHHIPKPVYEQRDVTVLWNQAVHSDRNFDQKEAEKKLKYKSLCVEV